MIKFNSKEEWLQLRKNGIGGSDLACILGHSPYKNAKDIYKSKLEDVEQISNKAIEFGNDFEDIVFNAFKYKYKNQYETLNYKDVIFKNMWMPFLQASVDGVLVNKNTLEVGILEIKTAQEKKGKWYDTYGNRIVPQYYLDQAIHYFNTTNVSYIIFYTLINYEYNTVDRDMEFLTPRVYFKKDLEEYCKQALDECYKFWHNNVLKRIEPNLKISFR